MSFISVAKLRIKQAIAGEKSRGLLKFLMPDFIIGIFVGISSGEMKFAYFSARIIMVTIGVALFTSLAETRKFFYNGGDMERFYFVQPTLPSRLGSVSGVIFLDALVIAAVFVPAAAFSSILTAYPFMTAIWFLFLILISTTLYFIILLLLSLLPGRAADRTLTVLQGVMALVLLAAFQLSERFKLPLDPMPLIAFSILPFAVVSGAFAVFPASESLISKLSGSSSASLLNLYSGAEKLKRLILVRSAEEEAGFMFFISNLFRDASFRLSAIGVAATPVMITVFWSMQGTRFLDFSLYPGFNDPNFAAPIASLVVSGVLIFYFLCQNVLSSRDHEAIWLLRSQGNFNIGRFVMGVRKGILVSVHLPVTILVFLVSALTNPLGASLMTAATYYLLVHVAASWFSVMQKRFPFSAPFTRLGVTETVNLVFMLFYSMAVSVSLVLAYGNIVSLLMINSVALIFVGMIELFSVRIVNKRVRFSA